MKSPIIQRIRLYSVSGGASCDTCGQILSQSELGLVGVRAHVVGDHEVVMWRYCASCLVRGDGFQVHGQDQEWPDLAFDRYYTCQHAVMQNVVSSHSGDGIYHLVLIYAVHPS